MNNTIRMYLVAIHAIEKKLNRPMTESEKQGLWNCDTSMFMEAALDGFYSAKTNEDVELWLKELDGFNRGM